MKGEFGHQWEAEERFSASSLLHRQKMRIRTKMARIHPSKRSRRLALNDLNGAKAIAKAF